MTWFIWSCIGIITLCMLGVAYRLVKGPDASDRVVALDTIGVLLICVVGLYSIIVKTTFFLEIILLLAILSFIGTVAFSKFIEKGDIIDRDDTH
jgi:multicomponent Na+:H+ antiporter subunit F